jgi:hypothetical protein
MAQLESLPASARQGPERAALLATKLAIPQVPASLVPRARLIQALHEGITHQLVVVNQIERGFNRRKQLRAVATRYDSSDAGMKPP